MQFFISLIRSIKGILRLFQKGIGVRERQAQKALNSQIIQKSIENGWFRDYVY